MKYEIYFLIRDFFNKSFAKSNIISKENFVLLRAKTIEKQVFLQPVKHAIEKTAGEKFLKAASGSQKWVLIFKNTKKSDIISAMDDILYDTKCSDSDIIEIKVDFPLKGLFGKTSSKTYFVTAIDFTYDLT